MHEIEFPFPFKPYGIQLEFMRELYGALEQGKLGIFESPTGTGKSLSLICGSLTWLRDHEERTRRELQRDIEGAQKSIEELEEILKKYEAKTDVKPEDWLEITSNRREERNRLMDLKLQFSKYEKVDETIKDLRSKKGRKKVLVSRNSEIDAMLGEIQEIKQVLYSEFQQKGGDMDDDIILKEYMSDDEECEKSCDKSDGEEDDVKNHITKIYYCSRTHSQLSQFISEVKKSPFGADVRVVPLSSRQNSCINDAVLNLKSLNLMNNRCIELQKNKKGKETKRSMDGEVLKKKKTTCGCPFYRQNGIETMRDNILVITPLMTVY